MTPDGCIGVLSTELKNGCEKDESSQALATIFAAQLATLVAPLPVAVPKDRRAGLIQPIAGSAEDTDRLPGVTIPL